jgi:hypothetical protein
MRYLGLRDMVLKKIGIIGWLCLLIFGVLVLPSASAYYGPLLSVSDAVQSTINAAVNLFGPIFLVLFGSYNGADFLFAKILVFILMVVIINALLGKVTFLGDKKGINFLVALIVSIIAMRFISENQLINGILLPYGVLGVAVMTILPFLIFFYFLHMTGTTGAGRRLAWAFFAIVFFVSWAYKYDSPEFGPIANQIYWWTLVAIVIAFIFDKDIHRYFKKWEISVFFRGAKDRSIAALQAEYLNLINVDSPEAKRRRKDIEHEIHNLGGNLP